MDIGSVVQLKAGGPRMTVEEVVFDAKDNAVRARVVWLAQGDYLVRETFPAGMLREIEGENAQS